MSKRSELMAALCPDGVAYRALGALGIYSVLTGNPNTCHGTSTAIRDANRCRAAFMRQAIISEIANPD